MPIDPSIALGVRPVEMPNVLGQMAQMMQMRQAQQEYENEGGLRNALTGGLPEDPSSLLKYGKSGRAVYESAIKGRKEQLDSAEKRLTLTGQIAGYVRDNPTPENFVRAVDTMLQNGVLTRAQAERVIADAGNDPAKIKLYATQAASSAVTEADKMRDKTTQRGQNLTYGASIRGQDLTNARAMEGTWSNVIVGRRVLQQNSRTGEFREVQDPYDNKSGTVTVGPITNLPDTSTGGGVVIGGGGGPAAPITSGAVVPAKPNMLPETVGATPSVNNLRNPPVVANAPVPKTRPPVTNPLMVEEKPVWNEKAGVFMYPPSEDNPKGRVVETPALQEAVQKRAANQTLKVAGFDPKTGSNEISQLIEKSTSGLGANALSKIASSVGWGLEGAQAIAKLETRANQLTLDLAPNGSLGAGFSNDDRIFMLSKLGDVANPNKPVSVRLAAWEDVMERAARTAGVPYPKSAKSTGDITIDPAIAEALKRYPAKK